MITLLGADPQYIALDDGYTELGALAFDVPDGDISGLIDIDYSDVDTATAGTYQVTYNVSDAAGNPAVEVVRTVEVVAPSPLRITEMHYHPADPTQAEIDALPPVPTVDADEFEFIEILNTGTTSVDLAGVAFTEGIDVVVGAVPGWFWVRVSMWLWCRTNRRSRSGMAPGSRLRVSIRSVGEWW